MTDLGSLKEGDTAASRNRATLVDSKGIKPGVIVLMDLCPQGTTAEVKAIKGGHVVLKGHTGTYHPRSLSVVDSL